MVLFPNLSYLCTMKPKTILITIIAIIALIGCGKGTMGNGQQENPDATPYQEDTILMTYATNPGRALILLDSATALGNINAVDAKVIRATIFTRSLVEQQQDSAVKICEALLDHDSVRNNAGRLETVIDLLINIARAKSNDNDYLRWSTMKAELCREQGAEVELLRTEAEIGLILTHLGRVDEGMEKLDNSITLLDHPGSIDRMDAFIIAAKRKITVLNDQSRYAEVIPLAQRILSRLDHFENNAKSYAMDSYRLSWDKNPGDRDRYIDFSRAQANGFMAIAYGHISKDAHTYTERHIAEKHAKEHLAAFLASNYGQTFSARRMILPAYMSLGMYDEALKSNQLMVQRMDSDTINKNYALLLRDRAIIEHAYGHHAEAYALMSRYAQLSQVLNDSLHKSTAQEYAARYHAQEQEMKIQEKEDEARRSKIVAVALGIVLFVTLLLVFYIILNNRVIHMKNRGLVRMIDETKMYKERNEQLLQLMMKQHRDNSQQPPTVDLKALSKEELFQYLNNVIHDEKLYLDPLFDRQSICKRFHINAALVGSAFSQGSDYDSVSEFIRDCRLEHACLLLKTTDMKIADVATASGFSRATTFNHDFKTRYNLSPTDYRHQLTSEKS